MTANSQQHYLAFIAVLEQPQSNFDYNLFQKDGEIFCQPLFYSSYYEAEMGPELKRRFIVWDKKVLFTDLVELKLRAMELEDKNRTPDGNRTINIDPGLIGMHQVVVSTTKDYSHRIPISESLFVDLQFIFSGKTYQSLPWTYPDYQASVKDFNNVRKKLLK